MELKPGYKQADVGEIPDDWSSGDIADLDPFITSGSRGWAVYYADRGSAFLRITNLSRDSIYLDLSDLKRVELPPDDKEGIRTQLRNGDLLVSITADIGIIGFVDSSIPKPAYINQHIAVIRFASEKADSKFLSYFLASEKSQRLFRAATDQGAKAGMNLFQVRRIKAIFPPLPEQRAIAAALSDTDALLSSLDQLLAKKRDIKQAVMQQLLTGKQRLLGFNGEWTTKRLGEISQIGMGRTPSRSVQSFWGKGYSWISIADLKSKYISETKEEITALAVNSMKVIPKGTLIMSFKLSIGRMAFTGRDMYSNEAICSFGELKMNADFLYYVLGQTDFSLYGKQAVKGFTLNSVSLKLVEVPHPPLPEQHAIAAVLSDMDTEIDALQQRRDKTLALKQGMMQELLTGRTRLV